MKLSFSPEKLAQMGPFEVIPADELLKKAPKLKRKPSPESLEYLPNLEEQYESQLSLLRTAGVLENLSSSQEGIRGIDGKEYPAPTFQEVLGRCEAKLE
ncbi:MAG: hypothetical protein Q7S34_02030, partial [bacterium]|nr:hypothetical protein [bacterium]